jgi:hypothetical protein
MTSLVPVDHDPFAIETSPLPGIQGTNSFGQPLTGGQFDSTPGLHPVDYDPFMSAGEDAGRSFVSHLGPGVANLLGAPGDFLSAVDKGADWSARKLYNALGAGDVYERYQQQQHPKTVADLVRESGGLPSQAGERHDKDIRTTLGVTWPHSADLRAQQDQMFGTPHVPHTQAGKYAAAISEQVPGALLAPGGVLAKGAFAVGSGAGGEAADQLIPEDSPLHPYARAGGQILGGLPAAAGAALRSTPQKVVGQALGDITDADRMAAIQLMRDAQARGIQLTPAEAIQQVTGGGTGLGRMQRVVEGTKRGQEQMAPVFAQRPDQVRQAGMNFADTIAPPNPQPSLIGPQAQEAAQGGLDMVRGGINDLAEPFYQRLPAQTMPDAQYRGLANNPSYQGALAELRGNPELNGPIAHLPDNSLGVVNEVLKQLDTGAAAARQTVQNPAGNNRLAGLRGDVRADADTLAASVSPDWRMARDIVSQGRQTLLEPLEAGPTGAIGRTDDVAGQTGALYPRSPLEGAPNETAQTLQVMRAAEARNAIRNQEPIAQPGVGADLTRQHLVRALNEATSDLQPGPNQWGGAKYAKSIAGNPEQAATLRAGVDAVGGPNAGDELDTLLNVLRATGKRQPAGSLTAFNTEDLKGLGLSLPNGSAGSKLNPMTWVKKGEDAFRGAQQRANTDALVRMLLSNPDEAERFLAGASRYAPNRQSALGRALRAP